MIYISGVVIDLICGVVFIIKLRRDVFSVELLVDDAWASEDDKTGPLNFGVECFDGLYV